MLRKVFRTGNSIVVSLPREVLDYLEIREGAEIEVNLDRENRQVIIKPVETPLVASGVDQKFALQVAEFIEQYRPALEELAKK
jgi:putative addiction module antidote